MPPLVRETIVFIVITVLSLLIQQIDCVTEVLRPRGVPLSKKIFYDPGKEFTCLDGSASLPFVLVNDDYCDCDDASDEPGTAACPHGLFHCSNVGFVERIIPSSRVNDGICDCCDASDEYNSSVQCVNICAELGERMREENERQLRLRNEGNQIRQQYIEEAKRKRDEYKVQIEDLRKQKEAFEDQKNAKEAIKKSAEEREKVALDRYNNELEKIRQQREEQELIRSQEEDRQLAASAFKHMDLNSDNLLQYNEVQQFAQFDKDGDGVVSVDEAKFFLHAANEMDFEEFVESAWIIMKPHYLKDASQHESSESDSKPLTSQSESESKHDINQESEIETESSNDAPVEDTEPANEEEDDEEEDTSPPFFPPRDAELLETTTAQPTETLPDYDDETKKLVEEAKQARDEYREIEGQFSDLSNKIRELEVSLETDYGPDGEFMSLHGQCFELTDREYIYKLCPFDNASQRPKDGGTETNLGRWSSWIGSESNKYDRMKFDGGAQCWNGPARSVAVHVKCGITNEVTAASEPSRCEYAFDFFTPAVCAPTQPKDDRLSHAEHTEL